MGPALLPENLERLRRPEAVRTSSRRAARRRRCRPSATSCSGDEIAALAQWIYTPLAPRAAVGRGRDPRVARRRSPSAGSAARTGRAVRRRPAQPVRRRRGRRPPRHASWTATGSSRSSASPSRFALHGGPKFIADGRYVYFASRDGWITKYDLWNLDDRRRGARRHQHAQRRGVRRRPLRHGRQLPAAHAGAARRAICRLVKTFAATTLDGKTSSRVSAVYDAAPRAQLRRRAEGHPRAVGDPLRPARRADPRRLRCTTTGWTRRSPRRATSTRAARRSSSRARRLLLRPGLPPR